MNKTLFTLSALGILVISCYLCGCASVEDRSAQLWDMKQATRRPAPRDYTGLWVERWRNGKKSAEYHYKNGLKHGKQIHWHLNGRKQSEVRYVNGRREGKFIEWTKYGELDTVCHYRNSKKHGKQITYHKDDNGRGTKQKYCEESYRNGKRHGSYTAWDRDGRIMGLGTYNNGKLHGRRIGWYIDSIICDEYYENGVLVNPQPAKKKGQEYLKEMEELRKKHQ